MLSLDLLLLGFSSDNVHSGLAPGRGSALVTAGAVLFDRPNGRLLEEVLHFLLMRTNAAVCEERLCECWPVTNALQGRQFRQEVYRLVEELRRTGCLGREVVLRKSMLDEGVGERLEEALGRWAELLILRTWRQEGGEDVSACARQETIVPSAPSVEMTGAALACEMLLESSPHARLARHQQTVKSILGQLQANPHSVMPPLTPRPA